MESQISELFAYHRALKFSEIEKLLKIRSNKLAYHLKKLVTQGILTKSQETYSLAEPSELLIPYLSSKKAALPVILIHIGTTKEAFLIMRKKRPYDGLLFLPAGRLLLGETVPKATQRILKQKYGIKARFKSVHSISLEHIKKAKNILHSFVLFFVTATSSQTLPLTNVKHQKSKIIKSDYRLLTQDLKKSMKIPTILSRIN